MFKLRKYIGCFLLIFTFAFAGCGKKQEKKVVARIGSEKITLEDVASKIRSAPLSYQEYLSTEPGRRQFLDIFMRQKIMLVLAKKSNLHKRKDILTSVEEFKQDYKNKVRQFEEERLIEEYLKEMEKTELNVPDSEIEQYYKDNKKDFDRPVEIRLSHILLSSLPDAEEVVRKLKKGTDFETLAKEASLDPATSSRGGDLGTFKPAELLPEFSGAVKDMPVGKFSEKPVHTAYGYHVLRKTSQKILPAVSAENARNEIKRIIIKDRFDKWIEKQKELLKVRVYPEELEAK